MTLLGHSPLDFQLLTYKGLVSAIDQAFALTSQAAGYGEGTNRKLQVVSPSLMLVIR